MYSVTAMGARMNIITPNEFYFRFLTESNHRKAFRVICNFFDILLAKIDISLRYFMSQVTLTT